MFGLVKIRIRVKDYQKVFLGGGGDLKNFPSITFAQSVHILEHFIHRCQENGGLVGTLVRILLNVMSDLRKYH